MILFANSETWVLKGKVIVIRYSDDIMSRTIFLALYIVLGSCLNHKVLTRLKYY